VLLPARHRFQPRGEQDRERYRREAALRAQVADLTSRLQVLEKEQQIQFKRIAELQQQVDQAMRLLKGGRQ